MTIPLHPPAAWFERPPVIPLDRRLTITDEGRVFGYVKLRGSCHAGAPGCLDAPDESPSDFGFAHQGQTMTAEGSLIATANIGGGRHADLRADMLTAAAHYQEGIDNQLMRVRYGTDESGIWFSGALWPDADPLTVEHIRASPISGDWRFVSYLRAHDFAGATLVNIPGYAMANAGDARTSPSMMKAIAASGAGMSVDGGGNIVAYTPAENPTEEKPMCQSCTCQSAPLPVTASPATPCTCSQQKPACDCGGKNAEQPENVKALIASAQGEGEEAISFEQAVAMKFDEVFAQLAAHGTSIGTIEARRLAEQIME